MRRMRAIGVGDEEAAAESGEQAGEVGRWQYQQKEKGHHRHQEQSRSVFSKSMN